MAATTTNHTDKGIPLPATVGGASYVRTFPNVNFGEVGDKLVVADWPVNMTEAGSEVQVDDLDTGSTLEFSLELVKGATTKTIIDQSAAAQAGGVARSSKSPSVEDGLGFHVTESGYVLQVRCTAAAAGEQAGDVKVIMRLAGQNDADLA